MAGLSSLEIGKRGLQAQQYALDVTSNNIANINTPGYSRRTAIMTETIPNKDGGLYYGTGVLVDGIQSYRQEFFDKEIRASKSSLSSYTTDVEVWKKIEALLMEPTEDGIGETISAFFNTYDKLALTPEDDGLGQFAIDQAVSLSKVFNKTGDMLSELRNDIHHQLEQQITKTNGLIEDIANINANIEMTNAQVSKDSQTYFDQRAVKLEALADITDINVAYKDDGSCNVYANGIIIVSGKDFNNIKLKDEINQTTNERTIKITNYNDLKAEMSEVKPTNGTLYSLLKHYNSTLDGDDSGSEYSVMNSLNELANAFVTQVNNVFESGYGKDDTTIKNRQLFKQKDNEYITASKLKINEDILIKPRDLPLSSEPLTPGNGDKAREIARLAQKENFLQYRTPEEYYTSFIGKIGTLYKSAESSQSRTTLVNEQLSNQRESFMGVNEDEEAVNLIKYQKVYEACSRVINTLNEMLTVVVNLGR